MNNYRTAEYNFQHNFNVFNYIPKEKEDIARWMLKFYHVGYTMRDLDTEIEIAVKEHNSEKLEKIVKKLLTA